MFGFRSDLPLRKDATGRFMQWLVMVLVFMAAIAATINAYTDGLLTHWNRSVSGTLTVQVPAAESGEKSDPGRDIAAIVAALKKLPAVQSATPIPRDQVLALLQPWLGSGEAVSDLPLPSLIDVQLRNDAADATANIATAVATAVRGVVPTAVVDDHRVWLSRVTTLASGIGAIALTLMGMIAGALAMTVIFATRASLAEFAQVIDVLHLVGARDDDIAGQFARRALGQGVVGGIFGLILYAPAMGLVAGLAARIERGILPEVHLPPMFWVVLALLPVLAGGLAMITAHITVRRALRDMM